MIYRFTMISDEIDDFVRVIESNPDSTFLELHETILRAVGYTADQVTSFYICDESWEKQKEVSLIEKDCPSDEDNWVMAETRLSDLLEDEGQKLLYEFDILSERCFYIELSDIVTGRTVEQSVCVNSSGNAPKQIIDPIEPESITTSAETDELFGFNQEFDPEDFDPEGYDITED